ncbi:MAG TPA: MarR family transcriptional regulator [Solirubrobacterales bacterium]|nr:MarR family transcriptional regulator [Solirubrobacterales bacterium]
MAPEEIPDREFLGHLLWEVGSRVALLSEAALARTRCTPRSAGMLEAIASDPGTSFAEISRRLPVTPQAVAQVVARLEESELIERRSGERGRGVALYITEAGEAALEVAKERKAAFDHELAEALGEERHAELVRLLKEALPVVTAMQRGN